MTGETPDRAPLIWVTRPQPDADVFASRLKLLGFAPLIAPLLEIEPTAFDPAQAAAAMAEADFVIATSRNAIRATIEAGLLAELVACRMIAVGPGTARLAHDVGCNAVIEAGGQAIDIVQVVDDVVEISGNQPVRIAYLRGEEVAFDLEAALSERSPRYNVNAITVYRMRTTGAPDDALADQIRSGQISGVVLFSPRVASVYANAVANADLQDEVPRIVHYCLSERVAARISHLQPECVIVPPKPNMQEMLAVMGGPAAQSMH